MVLELMLRPHEAEFHPWKVFVVSLIVTVAGYAISAYLFPENYSAVSVFMIALVLTPIFTGLFLAEEKDEEKGKSYLPNIISVFWFMFLGVSLGYVLIYLLPFPEPVSQLKEIAKVSGYFVNPEELAAIFMNNMRVLMITYFFSVLFGATAVFILAWNASILGTWVSKVFVESSHATGLGIIKAIAIGFLSIAAHGIPEITAYFLAAVAGGLLSVAMIKRKLHLVLNESAILIGLSIAMLLFAALIEAAV